MGEAEPKVIPLAKAEKGSDELNFAEFPLSALTDRLPPDQKSLVFHDSIFDQSRGAMVERTLTIAASEKYGLPTPLDDEVILGLIQVTQRKGFDNRTVAFTRYELIKLLGWKDNTKAYKRIEQSLKRWLGVTLYWDNAWWSKEDASWVSEHFHIIDNITILDRERQSTRREKHPDDPDAHKSTFTWNEVVFRSFKSGNLKQIDLKTYTSLNRPIAKRIYRFLDKRFYRRPMYQWDLVEFACQKVGLSHKYNVAQIKRKLTPALEDLEALGFLEPMKQDERYKRQARGVWTITFLRGASFDNEKKKFSSSPLLEELCNRGIARAKAEALMEQFEDKYIYEKLRFFDYLHKKDNSFSDNPAGFLIKAIEDDYQFPKKSQPRLELVRATPRQVVPQPKVKEAPDRLRERVEKMADNEKDEILAVALKKAAPFLQTQYAESRERGGPLFEAVRENIIRAYLAQS